MTDYDLILGKAADNIVYDPLAWTTELKEYVTSPFSEAFTSDTEWVRIKPDALVFQDFRFFPVRSSKRICDTIFLAVRRGHRAKLVAPGFGITGKTPSPGICMYGNGAIYCNWLDLEIVSAPC